MVLAGVTTLSGCSGGAALLSNPKMLKTANLALPICTTATCGPSGGSPTPAPSSLSTVSYYSRTNYSGVKAGNYGSGTLPTIDGYTQAYAAGTYRNTTIAAYGNGSATLTGPTPSSGPFTLNNITFNTFPNSLAATFTHAKYGSGVVWLDQTNLAISHQHDLGQTANVFGSNNEPKADGYAAKRRYNYFWRNRDCVECGRFSCSYWCCFCRRADSRHRRRDCRRYRTRNGARRNTYGRGTDGSTPVTVTT